MIQDEVETLTQRLENTSYISNSLYTESWLRTFVNYVERNNDYLNVSIDNEEDFIHNLKEVRLERVREQKPAQSCSTILLLRRFTLDRAVVFGKYVIFISLIHSSHFSLLVVILYSCKGPPTATFIWSIYPMLVPSTLLWTATDEVVRWSRSFIESTWLKNSKIRRTNVHKRCLMKSSCCYKESCYKDVGSWCETQSIKLSIRLQYHISRFQGVDYLFLTCRKLHVSAAYI